MNDDRRKKFLVIGGLALLVLLTIFAVYVVFFRDAAPTPTPPDPTIGTPSGERTRAEERARERENGEGVFNEEALLRILSEEAIAGATTIIEENENAPSGEFARFLERETAHIFDVNLDTLETERLSNTTIPRIYEAVWAGGGTNVILRYLADDNRTIKTYAAKLVEKERELGEGETPFDLEGTFLKDNIEFLVASPLGEKIFWVAEDGFSTVQGVIANPDGSNPIQIFHSEFTEWLPQWFAGNVLSLTTKASGEALGYLYNLYTNTGELRRVTGEITGLTTLTSPDGRYVLYSRSIGGVETYILDTRTGEENKLLISTLPEKCAWNRDSTKVYCGVPVNLSGRTLPDAWYQGRVLFTDVIFEIDAETGEARRLYAPLEADNELIDIYKPFVSQSGKYLIFNNKRDMSLWAFTLERGNE